MKQRTKVIKSSKSFGLAAITGALLSAALWSCDEGLDYVEGLNSAPTVEVMGYKDGDNIRFKATSGKSSFYDLTVALGDKEKNIKRIKITDFSEGKLKVFSDNEEVATNTFSPLRVTNAVEARKQYRFEVSGIGKVAVGIRVEDSFRRGSEVVLSLEALENAKPVARLAVTRNSENNSFVLDASDSYDEDAELGGKIVAYRYTFLGRTVETSRNTITINFPDKGSYEVALVVVDENNEYSAAVRRVVEVEEI